MITNFFRSPLGAKTKQPSEDTDKKTEDTADNTSNSAKVPDNGIENKGGTDAENDLNNSLCDFETSSQNQSLSRSAKEKSKKQRKEKGKPKTERKMKSKDRNHDKQNKEDSVGLAHDDLLDIKASVNKSSKELGNSCDDGSGDAQEVKAGASQEISYQDFLKSNCFEKVEDTGSKQSCAKESEESSKEATENGLDESVVLVSETCKTPEKTTLKKEKNSFFTILSSRQLKQSGKGPKAPVVITVNVPDSPEQNAKPLKSFSIFDKSKAKSGFDKYEDGRDKEDKEKNARKSTMDTKSVPHLEDDCESNSTDIVLQENEIVVENVQLTVDEQRKLMASKISSLDQVVVKSILKSTQSTLSLGEGGLTALKSPPSLNTTGKETEKKTKKNTESVKRNSKSNEVKDNTNSDKNLEPDTPVKPKRKQRKATPAICSDSDFEEKLNTPKEKRKRKRINSGKSSDHEIEVVAVEESNGRRRRRSRKVYSSEIVESPIPVKREPIKLRLTR